MIYCHFHRERMGVGICVRCRRVVCGECVTRVAGRNHCHDCLGQLAGAPVVTTGAPRLGQLAALVAGLAVLAGLFWLARGSLVP